MSRNDDDSCGGVVAKGISKALAGLIVLGLMMLWEFGLNPSNNHSVIVEGEQVTMVEGVNCMGDGMPWHFWIEDTWRGYKKSHAKLRIWLQHSDSASNIGEEEVRDNGGQLKLRQCSDEKVGVALVWDVSSNKKRIHFRVPPQFELVPVDADVPLPQPKGG